MPGALNTQSDISVRYEQRCLKKRSNEQKIQRAERAMKREEMRNEISKEVSSYIGSEFDKKRKMLTRIKTTTSFF